MWACETIGECFKAPSMSRVPEGASRAQQVCMVADWLVGCVCGGGETWVGVGFCNSNGLQLLGGLVGNLKRVRSYPWDIQGNLAGA
jgi:hypothetical protein